MTEPESIHFTVDPARPGTHLFEMTCTIAQPAPEGQTVSMAAWIPGSYMIRDFARNVVRMVAESGGQPVEMVKLDKQTWRCAPCSGPLTLRYEVYAYDLSVRGAHLDSTHGYFNGTSLFLRVHGQDGRPCTVELKRPGGEGYDSWQVATTLPRLDAAEHGFGLYGAAEYDELVDHPVEMGMFTLVAFEACGVPHEVAITGRHDTDTGRLAQDLQRLCEHHIGLFGAPAPFDRYLFLVTAVGEGYGGLEHRASTSLMCNRTDLPSPHLREVDNGYRRFLGLCSHEYFHSWNVKRIKPAAFLPYDLEKEVHTPLLWVFEGFTAYYDDLSLARCGLIPPESYLELLGQTITRVLRGSGRLKQSISESSFDAWTKFYKQDENGPNAVVSYYTKGAMTALALDLTIRRESGGQRSLDDVMRALWERFGKTGQGVTEEAMESLLAEVADTDLSGLLAQAVQGTEDLALAELLEAFGIAFRLRPAESPEDQGGKPGKDEEKLVRLPWLGVRSAEDPLGARVVNVLDGSPAQGVDIAPGDVIVALDGLRTTRPNLQSRIDRHAPGDMVDVHAFRRDELMTFRVTLAPRPADTCVLAMAEEADETVLARRDAWLQQKT